jgi:leucine dehydrogenase
MWPYESEQDAIRDVLRLSRAMTYKNAMADLPLGGGKAVILCDPRRAKSERLLRAFGRFVESLGGRYITAEDVGVSVADMEIVARETRHVAGRSLGRAAGGDPSPFTARGVLLGIGAAIRHRLGRESLAGLRVAVQGVGHVGLHLCRLLYEKGADLFVSDVDRTAVERAVTETGAKAVSAADIFREDVDVFAPCALGAALNDRTIRLLRAKIVAGAANNQLAEPRHAMALAERDVLYAPDYVINAGGIINVAEEISGHYELARVLGRVERIGETLTRVFRRASESGEDTASVADAMAREKIEAARATAAHEGVAKVA